MRKVSLVCMQVLFAVVVFAQTPGPAPGAAPAAEPVPVPAAGAPKPAANSRAIGPAWFPYLQYALGINADDFQKFGMAKLSSEQLSALVGWMRNREEAEKESDAVSPYICGREGGGQPEDYKKVHVLFLDGGVPEILTGQIHERVQSMDDVELVYAQKDADLIVDVLGYENSSAGGGRTGYTLSWTTVLPCRWHTGSQDYANREFRTHHVQTSPTAAAAVQTAISTLNAGDLEEARQRNAQIEQALEQQLQK